MTAEIIFGVLVGAILATVAVLTWVDFIDWVKRKGWREPRERIERGPDAED